MEATLSRLLPRIWPEGAPEVYATALECRGGLLRTLDSACYERQCFFLNEELNADNRIKQQLASAAIPWGFDPVDIASDLLPSFDFLNDVPLVGKLTQGVDALSRQIRIWSGTLAFDGECAKRFIKQGYAEGMTALKQLKPKVKLNW